MNTDPITPADPTVTDSVSSLFMWLVFSAVLLPAVLLVVFGALWYFGVLGKTRRNLGKAVGSSLWGVALLLFSLAAFFVATWMGVLLVLGALALFAWAFPRVRDMVGASVRAAKAEASSGAQSQPAVTVPPLPPAPPGVSKQ